MYTGVLQMSENIDVHRGVKTREVAKKKSEGERETCVQARFYGRVFAFPAQYI